MVLQSLGNVQSDISEAQLTIGAAKVTTCHWPEQPSAHTCATYTTFSTDSNLVQHAQFSVPTFCEVTDQAEDGFEVCCSRLEAVAASF